MHYKLQARSSTNETASLEEKASAALLSPIYLARNKTSPFSRMGKGRQGEHRYKWEIYQKPPFISQFPFIKSLEKLKQGARVVAQVRHLPCLC